MQGNRKFNRFVFASGIWRIRQIACTENESNCMHRKQEIIGCLVFTLTLNSLTWEAFASLASPRMFGWFLLYVVFLWHFSSINTLCRCKFNSMKSFKVKLKTASDARMDEAIRQILLTRDAFHLKKKFWCKFPETSRYEWNRIFKNGKR